MKIDPNKLYAKLAEGLEKASDSLRCMPINLTDRVDHNYRLTKMLEDPEEKHAAFTLLECTFKNEDIYDYVFRRNIANEGLVAISAATDVDHRSSFYARFTKLDDSRLRVEIEESFSISRARGLGKLYDNGERVDFTLMQSGQIVDWICKIIQCSTEDLLDRLERKDLKRLFESNYKKFFNSDGSLKNEFADLDKREFLESSLNLEVVANGFMPYAITKYWQFESVRKGWTKSYEYEIDYSDAIVHFDENLLALKEKVKDRIYSALEEACKFKVNFRSYSTSSVDTAVEAITLGLKATYMYEGLSLSQGKFDEESFMNALEYLSCSDLTKYMTNYDMRIPFAVYDALDDDSRYKIYSSITVYAEFLEGSVVYLDNYSRRVSTESIMQMLAEDRNLDFEENYDLLKNEVLETYPECKLLDVASPLEVELDFSDLY